ncbi:MAG TPA: YkgJ family cysteine cluster protein [Planctomicrobium sp.]|nr:YkgJ family cysteine cluster protein [Planctomicrobium sp.]
MPTPPIQFPILQNWSCHNCGGCCRQHAVYITPEERARIESQKWSPESGIPAEQPLFLEERSWLSKPKTRLAHQPDGACVFLDDNGLCRIHGKFGEAAKPLACRIYPYAFHPAGNKLTVSLRFSCPSVADNLGKPVPLQQKDLRTLAGLVVPKNYQSPAPPKLASGTQLNWDDTLLVIKAIDHSLADESVPLPLQLLRTLFWMDLIEQSKFTKISGERLAELLVVLQEGSQIELPELPENPPAPSSIALVQFRLLAGQYARKDTEGNIDTSFKGRTRQLQKALQLTQSGGLLPEFDETFKAVPADSLNQSFGSLPASSVEMLRRYYRVKIQGLHFCGVACYGLPVVEGLQSLFLTFPIILALAKWIAASDSRTEWKHEDLREALNRVDHQHGYSPALGTWGARRRVKNLVAVGELQKLILWSFQ